MPHLPCNLGQVSCLGATPSSVNWAMGAWMEGAKTRECCLCFGPYCGAQVLSSVGLSGEPGPDSCHLCPPTRHVTVCMGAGVTSVSFLAMTS